MKGILVFLTLSLGLSVYASEPRDLVPLEVKLQLAGDLQLLMDDTVNEGQNIAEIIYHDELPNIRCKSSPSRETGREWAFCYVDFHIVAETGPETNRTCGVLYSYVPGAAEADLRRGPYTIFLRCMEVLDEEIPAS